MNKFMEDYFDNSGLTLIELIVGITLLGVVITLATTMLVQSLTVIEPSMRRMSAGQLTELAKNELATYLRTATSVDFAEIDIDDENGDEGPWVFKGFHPATDGADEVRFTFYIDESDPGYRLNVESYNVAEEKIIEDRTIVSNIVKLEIIKNEKNGRYSFDIFIKVVDRDGNEATKRAAVRSRN